MLWNPNFATLDMTGIMPESPLGPNFIHGVACNVHFH